MPERLRRRLGSAVTDALEAASAHVELQLGLIGEQLVFDDVSGELAVHGDDLVAGLEAGPGGRATRGPPPPRGAVDIAWPGYCGRTAGLVRDRYPGGVDVDQVLLASPRGFCAGVEMAIKALAWMTRVFEPPVYCYHEIVHNQVVVERFRQLGVVFVEDVAEVPEGAPLMLSAHGSPPEVVDAARARGGAVVNAVCPLVKKVHHEVKVRAGKGYTIVYVGHEGHQEAIGTVAVAPDAVQRVERLDELEALPDPDGPVAFLAQTTLAVDEWEALLGAAKDRWPDLWVPGTSDLCFATTNRQAALKAIAARCDAVVVIGSANSSNTLALERTAVDGRLHPGAAGQRGRRAARRPDRHGSGSSPGPPRPRSWSRRWSPGWPPAGASRRSGPSTRTSTSRCRGSCVTRCATWPRPRRWPAWHPAATRPPAARRRSRTVSFTASVALAGLTR